MPLEGSSQEALYRQDYQLSRINLGKGSHVVDMKFFKASNKKITNRVQKDAQNKQDMKEAMRNMAQYINAILHLEPKPLNEMSSSMDVMSIANQQFLDNLHKCKAIAKTTEEWLQYVLSETVKQVNLLDKASKETAAIIKKVELSYEGYEKERNNLKKVVLWIEDIQGFGLQNFWVECPVAGLDDKTLYIIKDCIEW